MNPKILFSARTVNAFHLFGISGYLLATATGISLTIQKNLPIWVLAALSLTGATELLTHTYLQKRITGKENLVYYRHEVAILALSAAVLWAIGQPVEAFLDITLIGVGVFLAFGRIGCFHVGCCHGLPARLGVRYSQAHADEGFPWYLVGVRLFPVQLVESFFVFLTVGVGVWMVLQGAAAGSVLVWYTVFYGSVRFVLEFFRGDPERPYWSGLSEAQWTSLVLMVLTAGLSGLGQLPTLAGQFWAAAAMLFACVFIFIFHKKWTAYQLLNPAHLHQIFQNIEQTNTPTTTNSSQLRQTPRIRQTQLGIVCSCGSFQNDDGEECQHFTFSSQNAELRLDSKTLETLGNRLRQSRHFDQPAEIISKPNGIFHLIFKTST